MTFSLNFDIFGDMEYSELGQHSTLVVVEHESMKIKKHWSNANNIACEKFSSRNICKNL